MMKRILGLFALCAFMLAGCASPAPDAASENGEKDSASAISVTQYEEDAFTLSAEDSDAIKALLSDGDWISDATKCESDYTFTFDDRTVRYHSECGSFNEYLGQEARSLTLSDADRDAVNAILENAAPSDRG